MLTNVIAYLHTTFAYQSAAMQLMVGQANLEAGQLHLKETLPITVPADSNAWHLAMPPDGVTGRFVTTNYIYRFSAGRLISIQRQPRSRSESEERGPSLIDSDGAYQLARQYLAGLSVDVAALESQYPHDVTQIGAHSPARHSPRAGVTNAPAGNGSPSVFRVAWGGRRGQRPGAPHASIQASMDILGSTKQCVGLQLANPALLGTPPLQVTNAAALLGPPPPPQHFVEELLGGRAAYGTVAQPDRVLVSLLVAQGDDPDGKTETTPVVASPNVVAQLSRALTNFDSYSWLENKCGAPDYGVRFRFNKGADSVEVLWCYDCDHVQVTHSGQSADKDCDGAHAILVQAVKSGFPHNAAIQKLSLTNSSPAN